MHLLVLDYDSTLPALFWAKVDFRGDCWEWTGSRSRDGYGRYSTGQKAGLLHTTLPHRIVYEVLVGPIPQGLHLDHLCRNPPCVNPDHLEPVTPAENQRRSPGVACATRTCCPRGHEYTPENTRIYQGRRFCRACKRIASRERDPTRRAAADRARRAADPEAARAYKREWYRKRKAKTTRRWGKYADPGMGD